MTDELQAAIVAVLTWAATGLLRRVAPNFWLDLDKRQFRLAVVALVAVGMSVSAGVAQGLSWIAIGKLALSSLAGSVLLRQATKPTPLIYGDEKLSRGLSIKTKLPK